jgi:hypothetical protein
MSILDLGDRDLVTYDRTIIPVPVTASQFRLDARTLAAGRGNGQSIDLTNLEEHTRSVAETLGDTLVNGSSVVLGGNDLPGYTNFDCRYVVTAGTAWNALTPSAYGSIISEVNAMKAGLAADGFTGTYILYIPTNYDAVMAEDYKAESSLTVMQRILAIDNITAVKVEAQLPASNVLLVQMTRSVVEIAQGQRLTTVTWDEFGGMAQNWAVLAVEAPALKCANARAPLSQGVLPALTTASGIAHLA